MEKYGIKKKKNMENVQIEKGANRTWCKALTTSNPGIPGDGKVSLKSL